MNDYQIQYLAKATMLERRAEAERNRMAFAARTTARGAGSRTHKRGPIPHLHLRSLLGRA